MQNSDDHQSGSMDDSGEYTGAEKREFERILFNKFLGVYTLVETRSLHRVNLVDISTTGCRFEISRNHGELQVGDQWAFRFYFTEDTYLPALLKIKHRYDSENAEEDYIGYGAAFDSTASTYSCLSDYVNVLYCYVTHAVEDKFNKEVY